MGIPIVSTRASTIIGSPVHIRNMRLSGLGLAASPFGQLADGFEDEDEFVFGALRIRIGRVGVGSARDTISKPTRHSSARHIGRVAVDLDSVHLGQSQACERESTRGLGREPPPNVVDVHPVPYLQSARANPWHQAGFPQHFGFRGIEHGIDETDAGMEFLSKTLEPRGYALELGRLVTDRMNPRTDVLSTGSERGLKLLGIADLPAPKDKALTLDPPWRCGTGQLPGSEISFGSEHQALCLWLHREPGAQWPHGPAARQPVPGRVRAARRVRLTTLSKRDSGGRP